MLKNSENKEKSPSKNIKPSSSKWSKEDRGDMNRLGNLALKALKEANKEA